MKFRTDISFLRAISVLMVMFFHFQITGFSGGFIGVDVFFVISGFLMTQITLKGFEYHKFSLIDFYIKRAKRIIPALQVMLIFVLLISVLFFFIADLKLNAKYVFLANIFTSNIYFWKYQNYFASGDNILLHTWSLGVEWQFYLIYPLILLLLKRLYLTLEARFWWILLAIMLSSLGLMFHLHRIDNNFSFYMLPTRFWELSIGGLAFGLGKKITFRKIQKNILVIVSAIGILSGVYFISESNIWPSPVTIIPVFATAAILSVNLDSKIFDNKIVKVLGDLSYSMYLWHWPWFILFKYFGLLDNVQVLMLIVLSLFSAWLSFKFIEKNSFFCNGIVITLICGLIGVISAGIYLKTDSFRKFSIYQNEKFQIANYSEEYKQKYRAKQFNPCGCYVTDNDKLTQFNNNKCLTLSDSKKNILLLGDSHMAQFSSEFRKHIEYNWLELSLGYILPIPTNNGLKERKDFQNSILEQYVFTPKPKVDLVIISVHWLMYHNPNINLSQQEVLDGIQQLITKLEQHKVKYLFIGQTEAYTLPYPKILMLKQFGREDSEFLRDEGLQFNNKLKAIIPKNHYIDIYNLKNINKYKEAEKLPYMFDSNHFTSYGASQVVKQFVMPYLKNN